MTSINTNIAATTALRTLQSTNMQLESTQSRISTGLKIGEAKDNAAYWSISTSLKSDNKAMGTVKDALGLGAATVDTAYQGLNAAKDVLDEIKSKLTAATQAGVDKNVIQAEIAELQKQLQSIAGSSVFSGENWLSVDSGTAGYSAEKNVVASFSRDASGGVSIGTIGIDIGEVALFDANASAKGIVDGKMSLTSASGRDLAFGGVSDATGNTSKAGLAVGADTGTSAVALKGTGATGVQATVSLGTWVNIDATTTTSAFDGLGAGDSVISTTLNVNGTSVTVGVTKGDITNAANTNAISVEEFVAAFNTVAATAGAGSTDAGVRAYLDGTELKLRNTAAGELNTLSSTVLTRNAGLADGVTGTPANNAYTAGTGEAKLSTQGLDLSGLTSTDKIEMKFKYDGVAKTIVVDTDVTDVNDVATYLNDTAADADFSDHAVASVVNGQLVITGKGAGSGQTVELTSARYLDNANAVIEPTKATGLPYAEQAVVKSTAFDGAFSLDADDKIQFDLKLNGATSSTLITIDKALIEATLSGSDTVANAGQYAQVLNAAFGKAGVTGITAAAPATGADAGKVVFRTELRSASASIDISKVTATNGKQEISVAMIDISDAKLGVLGAETGDNIREAISAYVSVVSKAISKVTTAASNLGAVASRIELQQTFVTNLMDTIDKGISGLVDADMNEESTRLQALQVKQQLGVQALSIANQSAQNVLSLFR